MASKRRYPLVCKSCGQPFMGWNPNQRFCCAKCGKVEQSLAFDNYRAFWERVAVGAPDDCWPWLGGIAPSGYGHCCDKNAHRVAWIATYGAINNPALVVCHTCDNRSCCNPSHLFLASQKVNIADKVRKDRQAKGERNGNSKLTAEQVLAIRAAVDAGEQKKAISRRFGVSEKLVLNIHRRLTWTHI